MHKSIQLKNINLTFSHKVCFTDFSAEVPYGSRIVIIGRNGSGKSSLLKMLLEIVPQDIRVGYVPQIVEDFESLSGGQRFNAVLTQALSIDPDLLLLDEPTNHLDLSNRRSLMRMLKAYHGTLMVVSHDLELLRSCIDTLWHIDHEKIYIFTGFYDNYIREINIKRTSIEQELSRLARQKKDMHQSLMQEQIRAAKSRDKGEKSIDQRKWPTVVSKAKALQASETSGRKKSAIYDKKTALQEKLSELSLPETIIPKFSFQAADMGSKMLVSIRDGSIAYVSGQYVLSHINFSIFNGERVAILGDNGSGKSTLIKAILDESQMVKTGDWNAPKSQDIGYLDQHYGTLNAQQSVLECIEACVPTWTHIEARRHLNDFLFRTNEEVNAKISILSGGEKARLSLAQIAAKTPKLLILDEMTNNLDLETREHVIQVLKVYPGAIIVISHDQDFLQAIDVVSDYYCEDGLCQDKITMEKN